MFRNQYNKMGLQCIVALLALMINGCSFYKVSVENNNSSFASSTCQF